jgi:putative tryptophan/tyrosine transport system substrate-binding protein
MMKKIDGTALSLGLLHALRSLLLTLSLLLLALSVPAEAQQPAKIPRIGFLAAGSAPTASTRMEAFRQGLRALGYVEGKDIVIEYRNAGSRLDQVPHNAAELVRLKVDVIVTAGPTDTRAAKEATSTIPIVMTQDSDPVGNGFIASLARPGGNITGLSTQYPEISGKRLELLKEIVPTLSYLAVLGNADEPGNAQVLKEIETAADAFRVKLRYLKIRALEDIETASQAARKDRAEAVLVLAGPVLTWRKQIAELAIKSRLPAIYDRREFVDAGGLMSYGVSVSDLDRRAATYVDRILKGANPTDLPVEQPTKFELVINLKTAKELGLTIPQSVLYRADRVIR